MMHLPGCFIRGGILNLNKAVRKIAPVLPDTNTAVSPLSVIGIIAGLGAAVLFRRRG